MWGANLILTLGMVMLQLGCAWTMTSLTDNAVLVTMVQTMMSLPFFFFSIRAGMVILSILFVIGTGLSVQQAAWKPFLHSTVL